MSLNLCFLGVHLATGVLMEFVQKSLLVINRSGQQLPAMMNLDPDFGQCLLLVTNEEGVSSQCLLYPETVNPLTSQVEKESIRPATYIRLEEASLYFPVA